MSSRTERKRPLYSFGNMSGHSERLVCINAGEKRNQWLTGSRKGGRRQGERQRGREEERERESMEMLLPDFHLALKNSPPVIRSFHFYWHPVEVLQKKWNVKRSYAEPFRVIVTDMRYQMQFINFSPINAETNWAGVTSGSVFHLLKVLTVHTKEWSDTCKTMNATTNPLTWPAVNFAALQRRDQIDIIDIPHQLQPSQFGYLGFNGSAWDLNNNKNQYAQLDQFLFTFNVCSMLYMTRNPCS